MLNNAICVEVCVVMGNINLLSCIWWFLIFQTRGREGVNAGLLEYHLGRPRYLFIEQKCYWTLERTSLKLFTQCILEEFLEYTNPHN